MKFWNKMKQFFARRAEESAREEVCDFLCEIPNIFGETFPYYGLRNHEQRLAYKEYLTDTYTYQPGDDLLAKKKDFIDQYTVEEQKQYCRFTWGYRFERARCKAWRDHEQVERGEAQKDWQKVVRRNYQQYMHQRFMNQKTR